MRKQVTTALTMLSFAITLAVTSTNAQSHTQSMRVTIPFEFIVNGETLPAGVYTVKRAFADKPEMLMLSSTEGGSGLYLLTNNVRANTRQNGKLIFHQYGDRYFLSQIWQDGDNEGRQLFKCREERASAREVAKDTMKLRTLVAKR